MFQRYPGLGLLTMDARYAERDLCQAIVSHGGDYLVRIKGNQPTGAGRISRWGLTGRDWGSRRRRPGEKAGVIERRGIWTDNVLAGYIRDELGFPEARGNGGEGESGDSHRRSV